MGERGARYSAVAAAAVAVAVAFAVLEVDPEDGSERLARRVDSEGETASPCIDFGAPAATCRAVAAARRTSQAVARWQSEAIRGNQRQLTNSPVKPSPVGKSMGRAANAALRRVISAWRAC